MSPDRNQVLRGASHLAHIWQRGRRLECPRLPESLDASSFLNMILCILFVFIMTQYVHFICVAQINVSLGLQLYWKQLCFSFLVIEYYLNSMIFWISTIFYFMQDGNLLKAAQQWYNCFYFESFCVLFKSSKFTNDIEIIVF